MRNHPRLETPCFLLTLLLLATGVFAQSGSGTLRKKTVARQQGAQHPVWHAMHTGWTFQPELSRGPYDERISDLVLRGGRIFYACAGEIGCIEKSTGQQAWSFNVPIQASVAWSQLAVDDRFLYVAERALHYNPTPPGTSYRLRALRIDNGKPGWECALPEPFLGALCLAANLLLVPLKDGTLIAVNHTSGKPVWCERVMTTDYRKPGDTIRIALAATERVGIAQVGAYRLVAFRLSDGAKLWSYPQTGRSIEGGEPDGMALREGILYAQIASSEMVSNAWDWFPETRLVALEATSGRQLWMRHAEGGRLNGPVTPMGDLILADPNGTRVAVRLQDGHTAWVEKRNSGDYFEHDPILLPWRHATGSNAHFESALFEVWGSLPLVNGVQRRARSCSRPLDTLVMRDPATGREQWRWQPEDGRGIGRIVSDGNRLYISDGASVRAVETGASDLLSGPPERRREIAKQRVATRFIFNHDDFGRKRWNEAVPTLLRLGPDSVPPLLDYIRHEIALREMGQRHVSGPECYTPMYDPLSDALDILSDIGDRACVPALIEELDHAKQSDSRRLLAEALIRLGDLRAVPGLFRYAQSEADCPDTRQDALYWVCRAPETVLPQAQVTAYLLASLANRSAPTWLRLFARFELLNARGEPERQAALAAFESGGDGRFLMGGITLTDEHKGNERLPSSNGLLPELAQPDVIVIVPNAEIPTHVNTPPEGFPNQVYLSRTQSTTGEWWAAFFCDYLGDYGDLWFVRSSDGKHWTHPTFGLNLNARCSTGGWPASPTIRCQGAFMEIAWEEEYLSLVHGVKSIPHHERLALADISRDSDGNGLTDLLKQEFRTNPRNPDTHGDGVPNNPNKNPAYRPHALTDEQGIFQAVVEALCQVGRAKPDVFYKPVPFGGSSPLVLYPPPGSDGVRILGHPGPVLFRNPREGGRNRYPQYIRRAFKFGDNSCLDRKSVV